VNLARRYGAVRDQPELVAACRAVALWQYFSAMPRVAVLVSRRETGRCPGWRSKASSPTGSRSLPGSRGRLRLCFAQDPEYRIEL